MKYFKSNLLTSIVPKGAIEDGKKSGIFHVLSLFFLLLIVFGIGGCTSASKGESEIMRALRETDRVFDNPTAVRASYFFYPSTMRMVNIDDMPNWNGAIKDVRRLSVLSMWSDRFDQKEIALRLEEEEGFSLYAEMENEYSDIKILGRNNGAEAVFMIKDSTTNYVFHLLGKVNYVKLMKLSTDLRDTEKRGKGIDFLMKALSQDEERAARQRHYQERRDKREAAEKLRQDSIKALELTETEITE